jgi:arylsulfatase A-like enzyme
MLATGIIDERYALPPRPASVPAWADVDDKARWARLMAVYAAMIDRMDQGIGRVVRALEETGLRDDTLIVFLSDNGATMEDVAARRLDDPSVPIGAKGSYVAYLEPWANVSNTPFRLYKNWVHEGGIITPLILNWPRGITGGGRITSEWGHVIDLMPTVLELTGASYPETRSGRPVLPYRGRSLAPVFGGGAIDRESPVYWAYGGNWAIRDGRWKLVHDRRHPDVVELYDLRADPAELRNVASEHPALVTEMRATWQAWAERVGAREAKP